MSTAMTAARGDQHDSLTPAISLRALSKQYAPGAPTILDGIDLEVQPGEFVCLLGASGCGKSTLLALLAGLEAPTAGEVRTKDRAALMFQEPALLPWLTAGKNVELALRFRGVDAEDRKQEAQRLLELVHLERSYDQRPHELSGGMRQRVALARALAQNSNLLLMDEPFAALDAVTRDILHEELLRIWEETQLTIVFVTHNVREAIRLGQRVLLMSSRPGRIVKEWQVKPQPQRIDSEQVAVLAAEITDQLRAEIRRHAN